MRQLFTALLLATFGTALWAQQIEVTPQDSALVVTLLQKAKTERGDQPAMLYFAKQFVGLPYVAHTLENGEEEHLIVNLHEFDCTTLVETAAALTLCDKHDQRTFKDYCHWLTALRYREGKLTDYTSRLHYFTWWGEDNEQMGLVECISQDPQPTAFFKKLASVKLFNETQTLNLNYMSEHPGLYKHLKDHPERVEQIHDYERITSGKSYRYIPTALLKQRQSASLGLIRDGDILAMITTKAGLDTSHLGIAFWQEGRLHMLHASSLRKRVVMDEQTLFDYQQKQPTQVGIRVFRMK